MRLTKCILFFLALLFTAFGYLGFESLSDKLGVLYAAAVALSFCFAGVYPAILIVSGISRLNKSKDTNYFVGEDNKIFSLINKREQAISICRAYWQNVVILIFIPGFILLPGMIISIYPVWAYYRPHVLGCILATPLTAVLVLYGMFALQWVLREKPEPRAMVIMTITAISALIVGPATSYLLLQWFNLDAEFTLLYPGLILLWGFVVSFVPFPKKTGTKLCPVVARVG